MPKTRRNIEREAKVGEILDAAERAVRSGGFGALTVTGVARELGVANNAVYWYFPTKDDLATATFEHLLGKVLARKRDVEGDLFDKVVWFVDQLGDLYPLRASLNAFGQNSPVVQGYLAGLSERLRSMIRHVLEPHVPASELPVATSALAATVQGALLEAAPWEETKALLIFVLEKLIGREGSSGSREADASRTPAS